MAETFKCPSCNAPLEFEGKMTQKCPFCGSSVIVPSDMFYRPMGGGQNVDLNALTGKALKIAEIQQELRRGNKIMAIKIFRETFGTGLKEAKDAVEAMERGESVDISGMQVQTQHLKIGPEGVEAVKKAGIAIGGSILGTFVVTALIISGVIAAILWMTFSRVDQAMNRAFDAPGNTKAIGKSASPTPTPDAEEILKFGGEGTGAGRFKDNRALGVDGNGRIYSSDYASGRVQVFDATGKFITQWTAEEAKNLYDLTTDRKGNVYISTNKAIAVFEGETGKLLQKAEIYSVNGLAIGLDGKLYVSADRGLVVMDATLKKLQEFKDAAERASSNGFRKLAVDGNGNMYVIDGTSGDICKFAPDGKFLNRIATGSRSPNGVAIDPKGRIFVSDTSVIYVLDESGRALKSFKATQAFGMTFNDAGELFVASRPFVTKYKLNF
jgi:streptogramin lyase/endogenous inhibitor of DNA gyrase (YacG/DUF329 family)